MARKRQQKVVINIEDKGDKQIVSMIFVPPLSTKEEFDNLRPKEKMLEQRASMIGMYVRDIVSTMPETLNPPIPALVNPADVPVIEDVIDKLKSGSTNV